MKKTSGWSTGCAVVLSLAAVIAGAGADAGPLRSGAGGTFNVKKYGAVGNGTTDDTAAIQRAIAAASAKPGSTVLFPEGNYLYSQTLNVSGITLAGQRATITAASAAVDIELNNSGSSVKDLTFASKDATNSGVGVSAEPGSDNFEISNCTFQSAFKTAVQVKFGRSGRVLSNRISVPSVALAAGVRLLSNSANVAIENNLITGQDITEALSLAAVNVQAAHAVGITRNNFQGLFFGVYVTASDSIGCNLNTSTGCHFGLYALQNQAVTMESNRYVNRQSDAGSVGIVERVGTSVLIRDNSVEGASTGISSFGDSNIQINDNKLSKLNNYGIFADTPQALSANRNDISTVGNGGIMAFLAAGAEIRNNQIQKVQHVGIFLTGVQLQITDNDLKDTGLSPASDQAVIFVNAFNTVGALITGNSYNGAAANLAYFIWCVQASPPAVIEGNKTNTMLANRIGS